MITDNGKHPPLAANHLEHGVWNSNLRAQEYYNGRKILDSLCPWQGGL